MRPADPLAPGTAPGLSRGMVRSRLFAFVIALIALGGIALQFVASSNANPQDGALQVLWDMLRYFTILTNLMVAATYLRIAAGRPPAAPWQAALLLWIGITAVVYQVLLAAQAHLSGLGFLADRILHGLVPATVLLWWLVYAPKTGLRAAHAIRWLGWPLLYFAYAVARAQVDGIYPYSFIDLSERSVMDLTYTIGFMAISFWLSGLVIVLVGQVLRLVRR